MMLRLGRTGLLAVNDAARQSGLRRLGRAHGRFMVSACQSQAQKAATESEIRAFVTKLHTHMGVAVVGTAAALTLSMSPEIDAIAHARAAEVLPASLPAPVSIDRKLPWHLFDEIGSGSFGTVRLGMSEETGQVAAIKIVEPDGRNYATLEREIAALKLIKALGGHRNIVDLQDVYVEGRRVYLVTELVRGGELYDHVVAYGAFNEYRASAVTRDMCEALSFLHRHGLVHKDVKPENILMTSKAADKTGPSDAPIAKLIDFGSAGPATTVPSNLDDIGTSAYLSPELLQTGVCSTACDMWSLGCVLYIALSGAHPFDLEGTASDEEVEFRIKHMPVTFDFGAWTNVSADAKDVITRLLHKDPAQRLTADQLLVHPWIISHAKPVDPVAYAATSPAVATQIHV